jgi:transposase
MRKTYPTDLSDAEWECIEPHLPTPRATGRPRRHSLREILDAIYYIVRSGCAWRLLAHELPPWKTIHHYFRILRMYGTWEQLHTALPNRLRVRLKRDPQPSTGIVDSQSVKTTGVGRVPQRGFEPDVWWTASGSVPLFGLFPRGATLAIRERLRCRTGIGRRAVIGEWHALAGILRP